MTQKIKFGSDPKILPLDVHFTDQTTGVIGQKKNFLGFYFPIPHWKGHILQTKVYKNMIPLFFCFSKVIEVYKLLKSGGSYSFYVKENTKIKCICYTSNMFSKLSVQIIYIV